MSVTYLSAGKVLDFNFGATSYTPPGTLYMGVSTSVIQPDGSGYTEPVGGAYARVAVTNNKTNFTVASNGTLSNATAITFVESTAAWGTITYAFLADALTAGNVYWFEALPTPKAVASATTVLFSIGSLVISMTNA